MASNEYGWSEALLKVQLDNAIKQNLLPYIKEASERYQFPRERILAIMSRETNIRNIKGDYSQRRNESAPRYHGFCFMQVDVNTDPEFCRKWDAAVDRNSMSRDCILLGAEILKRKYTYLANKGLSGIALDWYAVAAYNGGEKNAHTAFLRGKRADSITTGKNYASDVFAREAVFAKLLRMV